MIQEIKRKTNEARGRIFLIVLPNDWRQDRPDDPPVS